MPAIRQDIAAISGRLDEWKILGSDGWGKGTLLSAGVETTVVGKLVGVRAGDSVDIEGVWDDHPRHGRQLKVRSCTLARVDSNEGVVTWMAATLPEIGEGRARVLVERFGARLWDVMEHGAWELESVDGITARRAQLIHDEYMRHKSTRDHMVALRGWGLTDGQIARCVEKWKTVATAVERIRENPYELSREVYGFGFQRADKVARRAGVAHNSPHRIAAGVEYVLEEAVIAGNCFLWGGALKKLTATELNVDPGLVADAIRLGVDSGRLVWRQKRIYPKRMDDAEQALADALLRLLRRAA